MKITVYGAGYVGQAVIRFLRGHFDLQVVDPRPEAPSEWLAPGEANPQNPFGSDWENTDYAIICVPTPMSEDGSADLEYVGQVLGARRHSHYLIKSTVPPGTTEALQAAMPEADLTFSPEYIGEGKYDVPWWKGYAHPTDMSKHDFHIFGSVDRDASRRWVEVWQKVAGWTPRYIQTHSRTAELCKYAENMYLAAKKVFCSELYGVAEAFGVDYHELRELWLADVRIGPSMTLVFPDKLAYGGKCLPKDTSAIVAAAAAIGYDAKLFRAVIERNHEFAAQDETYAPE